MVFRYLLLLCVLQIISFEAHSQVTKFGFDKALAEQPQTPTTFCVPNDSLTLALLNKEGVRVKYKTDNWLFITTTPLWIDAKNKSGELQNYYFEFAPPAALADSARTKHHVVQVHNGSGGLSSPYTGKGVIVGYVDQGLDWNHPDFIDENGNTRVIRYWDHTTNTGGVVPQPYNYGIVWDSSAINNGTCTSSETGTAHGTTVAGQGSGNGRANGTNIGMAPESSIIIIESNFTLNNWTLSIADACDYIFKVADTLGMPAIVNLSLGTYLGSHDGNDPASEYIETLLDEKEGRLVVCAAGNSGAKGKYHVRGITDTDTSFVWVLNNPSTTAAFGANHIYFDLWSDVADATFDFAFAADRPAPTYGKRGQTLFRGAMSSLNIPIFDTIYNSNGSRIATIETYTEIVDGSYHMEVYFSNIDSTAYYYRFMTTGTGKYDMWSGSWLGLNNFVTTLPSSAVVPEIIHYHMPDTLQTIVSSWACSEKVITVGNIRNRLGHIDNNNNQYYPSGDMTPPGRITVSSSKGPNRHNAIKPDVCAAGDVSLTAAPLWLLTDPSYNAVIDSGGWHARNGGTSMASPVVAGIAALYFERCNKATWQDFKNDLIATSYTDSYTGLVPNYAYGYGKPHALDLLLLNEFTASVSGPASVCSDPVTVTAYATTGISSVYWSNAFQGNPNPTATAGPISAEVYNSHGCRSFSDTLTIAQLEVLAILPILQSGNTLATLSFTNYQWTLDGTDIPGANQQTLEITPPYGTYTCYCVSADGCISETPPLTITAGLTELTQESGFVYPNPTMDQIQVSGTLHATNLRLVDLNGQEVELRKNTDGSYFIGHLSKGTYILLITTANEKMFTKITKL